MRDEDPREGDVVEQPDDGSADAGTDAPAEGWYEPAEGEQYEGYEQGYAEGYEQQYDEGYDQPYEQQYAEGGYGYDWGAQPAPEQPPQAPQRAPIATTILALALVVALVLAGSFGIMLRDQRLENDQLRQRLGASADPTASPTERASAGLTQIAAAVERLRELRFQADVVPEVLSPEAFRARVRQDIERETDRDEIVASQKILATLGVIPEDYDLYRAFVDIQQEQIGGFYDNKQKRLVVPASDAANLSPFDEVVLAHEYTHALTDQHFDLGRIDTLQEERADDKASAYVALAEGDAELVRALYEQRELTPAERDRLDDDAGSVDSMRFDAAPRFIQEVLLFPYMHGPQFAKALYDSGGFPAIDRAYRDPPTSTEQILHPRKYISVRDEPQAVRMPDVRARMGSGWTELDAGEVGELDLRLIGDHAGSSGLGSSDAQAAAAGWDGGRYVGVTSSRGTLVAMLTVWDSETEAREASRLYGRWLPLRYRNEGSPFDAGANATGWAAPRGAGIVVRDGTSVAFILGPSRADVERARGAFS